MVLVEELVRSSPLEGALRLKGFDYIEFYVGNAHQAAHFYRTAFGFDIRAYSGLETGARGRVSYVLEQRNIRLVLTSALDPDDPVAEHVRLHGDGIKDLAFTVDDAEGAFHYAVSRGALPLAEPSRREDDGGEVVTASIATFGDTIHTFVERRHFAGAFMPDFAPVADAPPPPISPGLAAVDHCAVSMMPGTLDRWVEFYEGVLGFRVSHQEDVETEYSAMNSKVVQDATGKIKFPLVEPAPSRRRSQIQEYLAYYNGPGVQHVALLSGDIVRTVRELRAGGNQFLRTPAAYYEMLADRVGLIDEDVDALRSENILVDRDEDGYLMQIFTKPVQGRPTVFMEAIQRRGARGFGSGNIKALFNALEREQARRGNL